MEIKHDIQKNKYLCKQSEDLHDDKVKREVVDGLDIQNAAVRSEMLIKYWSKSVRCVQGNIKTEILACDNKNTGIRRTYEHNHRVRLGGGRRKHSRTSYATIKIRIKIFDSLSYTSTYKVKLNVR